MPELQRLRADHAPAVLAFERANRAWFAASVSDRGDDYFQHFDEGFGVLLAERDAGHGAFYVLVDDDGSVLGRFNLELAEDGTATLGYRIARRVAGRGVDTSTVREVCALASSQYGVRLVRAATSHQNLASQRVLVKAGFVPGGPAGAADLGGKHGTWYELETRPDPLRGR